MKKFTAILALLLSSYLHAQTNVSGGIFSNATWTQANSPYIVTGNIVVFPGATLIIDPGVTVKFNDGVSLEIRQSALFANGTSANHIVFTSNNPNPVKGSWDKIFANQSTGMLIQNCEFHYAADGITGQPASITVVNSIFTENIMGMDVSSNNYNRIDSCIFRNNTTGQSFQSPFHNSNITNCFYIKNDIGLYDHGACNISNCVIDSNTTCGLKKHFACGDTIRNCEIKYNGLGISHDFSGCGGTAYILDNDIENNSIGILMQFSNFQYLEVHNNLICANTLYNFKNATPTPMNATNNCWCSIDSSYIASTIYDAYDDVSSGIVSFTPLDNSAACPMTGVGIKELSSDDIHIYPNPAKDQLTIETNVNTPYTISLYDLSGRTVLNKQAGNGSVIDILHVAEGIYTLIIQNKDGMLTKKLAIVR
jgi:hypothetical protein